MQTSDFDYRLPQERIAQTSVKPRDQSRLLVLHRTTGDIEHRRFFEIETYLKPGDLLVMNDSRVFKARLQAQIASGNPATPIVIEIFLLRPHEKHWLCLAKPGKKLREGMLISFADTTNAVVKHKRSDGTIEIDFNTAPENIFALADRIGSIPTPPYVHKAPEHEQDYQTAYAKHTGSVAAPTAGFHFTPELIERLKRNGVRFAFVTLHVGLGTFQPMKTETLDEHVMHHEWIDVPDETRQAIQETKTRGGRVIAVGTTTVRSLESPIQHGLTNLFIQPGFTFKVIDGLITNFHLPKSTLLVLVSAFAGRDAIMRAYHEALANEYRFYSFGDAMFIF